VVGHHETAEAVVSASNSPPTPTSVPTSGNLAWLIDLIYRQQNEPVANPPAFITRYEYGRQTIYILPSRCCDTFSNLYVPEGNIITHPDGGITGQGDGRVSDFFEIRRNESVVWHDQRAYDPRLVQLPAPTETVEVLVMENFPVQYSLAVVSGLPNTCVSYGGYTMNSTSAVFG
jgi:hypothetical protein